MEVWSLRVINEDRVQPGQGYDERRSDALILKPWQDSQRFGVIKSSSNGPASDGDLNECAVLRSADDELAAHGGPVVPLVPGNELVPSRT